MLKYLPNTVSIMRLLLILPISVLMLEGNYLSAFVLFTLAGLSDGIDGWLARTFGWVSAFGKIIDPVADKLLMIVTTVTLGVLDQIPMILVFLIIAKDLAVIGGVLVYTVLAGFPLVKPIFIGKFTTVAQLLLLGCLMFSQVITEAWLEAFVLPALIWIVVVSTILDGCIYLWVWTRKLSVDPRWNPVT